jgi:hypothetical protein
VPPMPAVGDKLDLPRIELLDGSVYEPTASAAKPLLVYWWSSTCPFCALQSPSMEKLWLSQRGRSLQMVALSVDKKASDAQAYLAQKGYSFPAAWTSSEWRKAFPKPKGRPITLLRGRDGRLILSERGQMFAEDVQAISPADLTRGCRQGDPARDAWSSGRTAHPLGVGLPPDERLLCDCHTDVTQAA